VVDRLIARQAAEAAGRISNTVAERIQAELARLAEEQLGEINGQFQHAVLDRATRMQLQPRVWESTGSSQALTLRLTVDRQSGLGAPAPFATRKQGEAPAVSMHETFADSLANAAFRAQNFPTELDANTLQSFNDQLPVKLLERRDFLPDTRLRVFLNPRQPVRLRFLRHHIELELRANRMQLDDDALEDARLTVAFRVRPNGETVTVTLDGEPTVTVGSQRSVDPDLLRKFRQAAREELLAALKQRVEFPSVIESDGWTLRPDRVLAEESWLTVFGQFDPPPAEDGE
jgi:hypothetical protein